MDPESDRILDGAGRFPLTVNAADGDLAREETRGVMIAQQIVLGVSTAAELQLLHGDLYPPGAPDGEITLQDLILLMQQVTP